MYELMYSKLAGKDAAKLAHRHHKKQTQALSKILAADPLKSPPRYESLCGELAACDSRRINLQQRLVYEVFP